jgi:hypothetical protein
LPASEGTDAFYESGDAAFSFDDWEDTELDSRYGELARTLDACWGEETASWQQQFAQRLPADLLSQIAATAAKFANDTSHLADRIANCSADILPNWSIDDLAVLVRPYAYAMRSDDATNDLSTIARPLPWESLSDVERARLTIVAVKAALAAK